MDLHKMCEMSADLAERIEGAMADDDYSISQVFMVVEVDLGDQLAYFHASSDDRRWAIDAFVNHAVDAVLYSGQPVGDDD